LTPGGGDDITPEAREAAEHARRRAQDEMPAADTLAGLAIGAAKETGMSSDEIRRLAADAISQSQQIAFLLGRLATLLDEDGEPPR
jgi:hypothetical protein